MKKTLVSALTAALVVGAASTTFAAANPFSDVPSDHWAYDAVTQLAKDGVIEGYGDTTFQGNKNITRYEMAQMVAKAMAKSNVPQNDKALIDKLAAEFSDELNNLGVRVSALEKNADKVKWNGLAEYTLDRHNVEHQADAEGDHKNDLTFRLEPSAEVNNNWHVKARLDASTDLAKDAGSDGKVTLKRAWAQGDYTNFSVKLGKFAPIDNDLIADTTFSGAEVSFGKVAKFTLGGGRISDDDTEVLGENGLSNAGDYMYVGGDATIGKLYGGARWHYVKAKNGEKFDYKDNNGTTDQANIWALRGGYNFDKNVGFNGFYSENADADSLNKAGSAELTYKGAQRENAGTWGAWVAYRHLGQNAMVNSTFDAVHLNEKSWELGANYAPFKNVVAQVRYADGKNFKTSPNKDVHDFWGRVDFFF
jgi:hypothetical protein